MKLTQSRYEAFARLGNEIDQRIDRACNLYNQLLKDASISKFDDETLWHNGTTRLDYLYAGVDIEWETSWSYGGHASGSTLIPTECLIDDTWEKEVTKLAKKVISKHRAEERSEARWRAKNELEELNRLKSKYEGDTQ